MDRFWDRHWDRHLAQHWPSTVALNRAADLPQLPYSAPSSTGMAAKWRHEWKQQVGRRAENQIGQEQEKESALPLGLGFPWGTCYKGFCVFRGARLVMLRAHF